MKDKKLNDDLNRLHKELLVEQTTAPNPTIVLDGNKTEDRSGAKGVRPMGLGSALKQAHESMDVAIAARQQRLAKKAKEPIQTLMIRLARYEARIKAIKDLCEDYIDRHGNEPPSTVARIKQYADGEYDR